MAICKIAICFVVASIVGINVIVFGNSVWAVPAGIAAYLVTAVILYKVEQHGRRT